MITTKPLKATCVDGDRHRRHGDACLARDRRGRALCVLCAEAKFRDSDDAPTTTERLALCSALADVAADASACNDAMLREATLDDIREAVTTLEDTERIARRVMGGAHPTTEGLGTCLRNARAVLRAHETLPSSA